MRKKLTTIWDILKETSNEFSSHKILRLSAALAYYAIFALPPLIIVLVTVLGLVWGKQAIEGKIYGEINSIVGDKAAIQIQDVIKNISLSGETRIATIIGSVVFVIGATSVFIEIQESLNTIWRVKPKPKRGFLRMVLNRLISFLVILIIGALITASIFVQAATLFFSEKIGLIFPEFSLWLFDVLNFAVTFVVMAILFAVIFKVLPDAIIHWRDVGIGSLITAGLFILGKYAISYYLGYSAWTSAYGAAGSVVILLLWVYYSSIILFIGAEFTQVYARRYGNKIKPAEYATLIEVTEIELPYR